MKIFVCSTTKDLGDLRDELYRYLKKAGHTPLFSEHNDFPTKYHDDSMTNCIRVVEECDLFVVLLDKIAGLPYKKREGSPYSHLFGLTISEAEYRRAREMGKPVCIFIRKRAASECAIYRQLKKCKNKRTKIKWYSRVGVYKFYDRLMHEKPHIPWRYTYDSIQEIIRPLNKRIKEVQGKSCGIKQLPSKDYEPIVVEPANEDDILWIAKKEKHVYHGDDIMPLELIQSWYRENPDCFWIIKRAGGRRLGNLYLFPLKLRWSPKFGQVVKSGFCS